MPGSIAEAAYRLFVRAARALSPLVARGDSKLARGVDGRRGAADRLASWARGEREVDRPLVWFHAPSVGEGLQARAVLEALRELRPDLQTVFTHFSPSAEKLAARMPVDAADYLPWDVRVEVRAALEAVRPDLVAFTKTEVWPVLAGEAERRGVPTVLVAATLPESSSRLRWPARAVLEPAFGRLAAVLAIADADAARFVDLGAAAERVEVTGDPGVDSAAERAAAADPEARYLKPFHADPRPTLVAGSTWPADEEVLVDAATAARGNHPDLRLLIAPHEPTPIHLEPLESRLVERGWRVRRLGAVEAEGSVGEASAVVVDRVGVLAHLYTVGTVAYVGGGFHGDGLHSVLEPAAAGLPVAFGPRHENSRAAEELVEVGGGRVVEGVSGLGRVLGEWLEDETVRAAAGSAAAGYVEGHRGAAVRSARRLAGMLRGAG